MDEILKILSTPIPDLMVVKISPFTDKRGAFSRLYCESELAPLISGRSIMQINHSVTNAVGSVRGMHFQKPPHCEMKFVRCIKGKVCDVAIDLRAGSATFLHWHAVELSSSNMNMIVIPEGFAHGFQVLEPKSELLYLHTAQYNSDAESGINYGDPCLKINWPLPVTDLSLRDIKHAFIKQDFLGIGL